MKTTIIIIIVVLIIFSIWYAVRKLLKKARETREKKCLERKANDEGDGVKKFKERLNEENPSLSKVVNSSANVIEETTSEKSKELNQRILDGEYKIEGKTKNPSGSTTFSLRSKSNGRIYSFLFIKDYCSREQIYLFKTAAIGEIIFLKGGRITEKPLEVVKEKVVVKTVETKNNDKDQIEAIRKLDKMITEVKTKKENKEEVKPVTTQSKAEKIKDIAKALELINPGRDLNGKYTVLDIDVYADDKIAEVNLLSKNKEQVDLLMIKLTKEQIEYYLGLKKGDTVLAKLTKLGYRIERSIL